MPVLLLIIFIDFIGFGLIIPLTAEFQIIYHLSPLEVGFFTASFSFANLVGSLIFGPLSDKLGRKVVLLGTTLLLSMTYLYNTYALTGLPSFSLLLLLRGLIGFFSGNIPVTFAAGADLSINDMVKRRKYMALLGSFIGLGFILGPTLGGLLTNVTNSKTAAPFYFAGILTAVCFILTLTLFKETLPKLVYKHIEGAQASDKKLKLYSGLLEQFVDLLRNKQLLITSSLYFGFFFTFAGFEVYLLTTTLSEGLHLSQLNLGLTWTLFAVFNSFFQYALIKVAQMKRALVLGFFIYSASILLLVFTSNSLELVLLNMLFCAIGIGFVMPNINTAISLKGNPHQQGTIFGINQCLGNLGRGLGPFILGGIFNLFHSVNAVWISMAVLIFVQGFVVIKYIPKDAKLGRKYTLD